jgi:hypothetical protein
MTNFPFDRCQRTKADAIYCGLADDANIRASDLAQDFSGMKFRFHAFGKSVDAQLPSPEFTWSAMHCLPWVSGMPSGCRSRNARRVWQSSS